MVLRKAIVSWLITTKAVRDDEIIKFDVKML